MAQHTPPGAQDRSSSAAQLKLQALQYVREALSADGAAAWRPHLAALVPPVTAAAGERYYKVGAEALRACGAMCRVVRPDPPAPVPADLQARAPPRRTRPGPVCRGRGERGARRAQGLVPPVHAAVAARLGRQDQDQEVKECALAAAATLAADLGDLLPRELPGLLKARAPPAARSLPGRAWVGRAAPTRRRAARAQVLLERLRNEMTRLAAVRAVAQVAASRLDPGPGAALEPALPELTGFLRKANRPLRQAALAAIEARGPCAPRPARRPRAPLAPLGAVAGAGAGRAWGPS